ncbi:MAG: sigma factor-like helix-turn-helix DNA-binding protein [Phycisphaeraceae bacterium]
MTLYQTQATQQNLDRRTAHRLGPEQIVRLAQALPADDRLLLERRYADGLTVTDIARRSRRSANTIKLRINRLTKRLDTPEFRFTLLHQDKMPRAMRRTATLLFIHGRSLRETARLTQKTLHRIRCDRATLQTLARVQDLHE